MYLVTHMQATPSPIAVTASRVVTPQGVLEGATLIAAQGRITAIVPAGQPLAEPVAEHLVFENATLLPGFIDVHVHGGGGWRVGVDTDLLARPLENPNPLVEMSRFMASTGVTGFLPTLSTASNEDMLRTVEAAAQLVGVELPGADVLGTHLEGPYINVGKKGAQRAELIRPPSRQEFLPIWQASRGTVRYMTLAPEIEGAAEFITWLTGLGVFVSAGHTDAVAAQMDDAYAAGLLGVTHLFNAMRGFHHREVGVAGWALAHEEAWAELICDGVHVHPGAMRVAIRAKGARRVAAITDAGAFTGLADGVYDEGYRTVSVKDGMCTLEDGTLAESMSPMNRNCMVLLNEVGVSWPEIATMTALVPATMLGLQARRGSLETGKDADLTVLGPEGEVLLTAVRGRVLHRA